MVSPVVGDLVSGQQGPEDGEMIVQPLGPLRKRDSRLIGALEPRAGSGSGDRHDEPAGQQLPQPGQLLGRRTGRTTPLVEAEHAETDRLGGASQGPESDDGIEPTGLGRGVTEPQRIEARVLSSSRHRGEISDTSRRLQGQGQSELHATNVGRGDNRGVLECVVNISEGRRLDVIEGIADAAGDHLLDVHTDRDHHRSVITIAGPGTLDAARSVARATVAAIDLRSHSGAHPRIGALDVVPFVPLAGSSMDDALAARDEFAAWAAAELGLPCFLYGPERSLPDVRRAVVAGERPDHGPAAPDPALGACAVGARDLLVAYNVWVDATVTEARAVAASLRGPQVRALGLAVGDRVQVSFNLVAPLELGPDHARDLVAAQLPVTGTELVGLVPAAVLGLIPERRWAELDLSGERTIEARLEQAGLEGGRFSPG